MSPSFFYNICSYDIWLFHESKKLRKRIPQLMNIVMYITCVDWKEVLLEFIHMPTIVMYWFRMDNETR